MRTIRLIVCLICASSALVKVSSAADVPTVKVTVVVTVPANTDAKADLYLAGNIDALGPWKANALKLTRNEDGTYSGTFDAPRLVRVEYKVTRGSWETVEKNADGSEKTNRDLTVEGDATEKVTVERWADTKADPLPASRSSVVGDLRLHEKVHSAELNNNRTVRVWLPPGYAESDAKYPVLYLQDGQNLFDAATARAGEWQADETCTRLIGEGKIVPLILVGIDNTPGRLAELTPDRDDRRDDDQQGGDGAKYIAFVVDTVKPLIDKTYRTDTRRESTAVGGASLGGLISLEIARTHADLFGKCLAMSPSLWWNNASILRRIGDGTGELKSTRVYFDTGTAEGEPADALAALSNCHALTRTLEKFGLKRGETYSYVEQPGARHNETAWVARFPSAVQFLFPRT